MEEEKERNKKVRGRGEKKGRMNSHNLLNVTSVCQPEEEEDHPWGGQVSRTFSSNSGCL